MATTASAVSRGGTTPTLKRSVGFFGLTFISLGSIIGSGWLLGALTAAQSAGPASLLSWVLAAVMLAVLALIHAELGGAYPVSGGTARFPGFAFGTLAGFTAGWAGWLQSVTIAPIEAEATLGYVDHEWHWGLLAKDGTLTAKGIGLAALMLIVFTIVNLVGVKLLSDSNSITVIWKTAVPLLTVVVLMTLSFHGSNFGAGGFAPGGAHGVFAALPLGVVFALQGFEQAIQVGGEARDPQRDISRAVIAAMLIGTAVYILLEIAFIGAVDPTKVAHGWANPIDAGDFGPYAALATGAGATWLTYVLIADAIISPAGTGLVYVGTSSRLSYAMGREGLLPKALGRLTVRGVPLFSILLSFLFGLLALLPFPSWKALVGLVTSATAIMYAFAPVSLAALRKRDPERQRPYRLPFAHVLAPVGFIFANLLIYWGGFEATWKLLVAIFLGRVLFEITLARTRRADQPEIDWRASSWTWPWLVGMTVIGFVGRYGGNNGLPEWVDLGVVAAFSLVLFYFAVNVAMSSSKVHAAVRQQEDELADEPEVRTA